ncbi:hypothetical protein [Paenibacillus rigui]|uniref:hypothetical protein n=1 Tax=Paenibacillus rigui TaxID=554312 RepID=UPI0015C5DC8D|nr:hypothetical protein [Paenibacillus rigui]
MESAAAYGVLQADDKQVKLLHNGGLGIGIDKAAVFAFECETAKRMRSDNPDDFDDR